MVEEAANQQKVLAKWLAETVHTFFEAKHKIILVPTELPVARLESQPFTLGHMESINNYDPNASMDRSEPSPGRVSRNLLEIFNWYCLKHLSVRGDFDSLTTNLSLMNMQGYARFCIEFKVPLDNRSVSEVFKKSQLNNNPLVFDQFEKSIGRLGVKLNGVQLEQAKR